jgi:hypothetical protein
MFRLVFALIAVTYLIPALLFIKYNGLTLGVWFIGITATLITVLVNIPLIAFCIALKLFKLWQSLLAGAIMGTVFSLSITISNFQDIAFCAIIGCLHTFVFWILAFWRNSAFGSRLQ